MFYFFKNNAVPHEPYHTERHFLLCVKKLYAK